MPRFKPKTWIDDKLDPTMLSPIQPTRRKSTIDPKRFRNHPPPTSNTILSSNLPNSIEYPSKSHPSNRFPNPLSSSSTLHHPTDHLELHPLPSSPSASHQPPSKINPTPLLNHSVIPSTRSTTRSVPKPTPPSIDDNLPKSASISTPLLPHQFSMINILRDHQKRSAQREILKRKRQEVASLGLGELPDRLTIDSVQVDDPPIPNESSHPNRKKLETSPSRLKLADKPRSNKSNSNPSNPTGQDLVEIPIGSMNDEIEICDPAILQAAPHLSLSKEMVDRLETSHQPNPSLSSLNSTQPSAPRIQKLLMDDLLASQQADLNRGVHLRMVFIDRSIKPEPPTTILTSPIRLSIDYLSLKGVSKHPQVIDFVHELIDNLNYSIQHPTGLCLDLVDIIPDQLIIQPDLNEKKTDERWKTLQITQQAILGILLKPIIDSQFPIQVAQVSISLIRSILSRCLPHHPHDSFPQLQLLVAAHQSFWSDRLKSCFVQLGLENHVVYGDRQDRPQARIESFDLKASILRIPLVFKLVSILSDSSCLDDPSRTWAFAIGLRLGLEPRSSDLRMEVVGMLRQILRSMTPLTSSSSIERKEEDEKKKDHRIRLMVEVLKVGISLQTWSNQLELLRLIPSEFPFRKFVSIGLLDLAVFREDDHLDQHDPKHSLLFQNDLVLYKLARWLHHISNGFTASPPAKEIYNSIREVSRRPHEKFIEHQRRTGEGEEATHDDQADRDEEAGPAGEGEEMVPTSRKRVGSTTDGDRRRSMMTSPFRSGFRRFLDRIEEHNEINETQFKAMIECFQIILTGLWDYIVDPKYRDQIKTSGYHPHLVTSSGPSGTTQSTTPNPLPGPHPHLITTAPTTTASGNVWIRLIQLSLESLDRSIKHQTSPQHQADRIRLKNAICRLAIGLDFLNQESFLIIKGIDSKGQLKLDRFFQPQKKTLESLDHTQQQQQQQQQQQPRRGLRRGGRRQSAV